MLKAQGVNRRPGPPGGVGFPRAPRYHALKRVAPSDWQGFLRTWIEGYDELDTLATLLAAR
jgi:hypothetical protein